MQNKGAIKFFAIIFALVCLYQLSFTFFTNRVEKQAREFSVSDTASLWKKANELSYDTMVEKQIIDSLSLQYATADAALLKEKNKSLFKDSATTQQTLDSLKKMYASADSLVNRAKLLSYNPLLTRPIFDSLVTDKENTYLEEKKNEVIFNFLWIRKYTYKDCQNREINLGLDLKGGMNVTLEISVVDVIREMSNNSTDPVFNKAIEKATEMEKTSTKDYVTLFGEAIKELQKTETTFRLSKVFNTVELKDKININSSDEDVLKVIKDETDAAIDRTFNILRTRIDKFGVTQPNIQKLSTAGRILVELPGIKDPKRVRKLLQATATLEFWKTWEVKDVYAQLEKANKALATKSADTTAAAKTTKADSSKVSTDSLGNDSNYSDEEISNPKKASADQTEETSTTSTLKKDENPIFYYISFLRQDGTGCVIGSTKITDTTELNRNLKSAREKGLIERNVKFLWGKAPFDEVDDKSVVWLYAIRVDDRNGKPDLDGSVVTDASQDIDQNNKIIINMTMNSDGAEIWKKLTGDEEVQGKSIAIVLDDYVYSAPVVNGEIPNGRSQITGSFTVEEAKDLANVLKVGKLPAPAKIVEENIVGPTLGKEAINSGLWSFLVAFFLTLIYMLFYYHKAGLVADIALFVNMFFVFGILASLGAVLTLPGIAGLVLTLGMDVDKNVIIYERVREEIRTGKGIRLAISDGYKHAYSSIIDSNITTLLTGIVLYIFGSGPIQGFATTLIIGIVSSLFCAIFITRLIFVWMMDKNWNITVWSNATKDVLTKVKINFIGIRKRYYILSLALVVVGVISLFVRGLSYGIDFKGGRTYVVRFDQNVRTDEVRKSLEDVFKEKPEVKTFGPNDQVKITTSFMIDDKSTKADSVVEQTLYNGLKSFYAKSITEDEFLAHADDKVIGKLSSQKVEPMIAYSLLQRAYFAVFFSLLIIFVYIAIRFRKWQWGLGGVISLFHDTFIVITVFSLLHGVLPFSLDIDQHFIAAILTIIGYSIMDSVIIFDRIREYQTLYPKRDMQSNMNDAINSTLSRTLNTSGITFMVLLAMFIFGGEVIRGFAFALMIGVVVGTYSSVLNATPIAYDLIQWKERRKARKEAAKIK